MRRLCGNFRVRQDSPEAILLPVSLADGGLDTRPDITGLPASKHIFCIPLQHTLGYWTLGIFQPDKHFLLHYDPSEYDPLLEDVVNCVAKWSLSAVVKSQPCPHSPDPLSTGLYVAAFMQSFIRQKDIPQVVDETIERRQLSDLLSTDQSLRREEASESNITQACLSPSTAELSTPSTRRRRRSTSHEEMGVKRAKISESDRHPNRIFTTSEAVATSSSLMDLLSSHSPSQDFTPMGKYKTQVIKTARFFLQELSRLETAENYENSLKRRINPESKASSEDSSEYSAELCGLLLERQALENECNRRRGAMAKVFKKLDTKSHQIDANQQRLAPSCFDL
ncbi:hypothetical protein CkaCkLH20_04409 [Colletotrichum karsti]|uniref:Uncharacterized protein n=1 Tax=Colletotrichum karsti TaxID=1095194 RepID=A0A9P6LMN2_9PEZI|nr:uncharacterized protein CkaCkLH20_04409 [Colletotrichum karsti]KAF9878371.1 hypothetical protein CkaCkLH20_04409 [Colletotrichum karsti]